MASAEGERGVIVQEIPDGAAERGTWLVAPAVQMSPTKDQRHDWA